jgi:hypothetical protein
MAAARQVTPHASDSGGARAGGTTGAASVTPISAADAVERVDCAEHSGDQPR